MNSLCLTLALLLIGMPATAMTRPVQATPAVSPVAEDPFVLQRALAEAEALAKAGKHPIAIFDLDDTLFQTAPRSHAILHEWLASPHGRPYAAAAEKLTEDKVGYNIDHALTLLDVSEADRVEAKRFWNERFFTSEYLHYDRPNPGAVAYVLAMRNAGAEIVYLTGRSIPMRPGTEAALVRAGFPLDKSGTARLIVKADPKQPDDAFKEVEIGTLRHEGLIMMAIDNEPKNMNLYHRLCPQAVSVYIDKPHSDNAPVLSEGIYTVSNFPKL